MSGTTDAQGYFLQQFGESAWNIAEADPITHAAATTAIDVGTLALDIGFFRSRWDRATPKERNYLRAMAEDGGMDSSSGEIARRLNRSLTSLGPTRAGLISKGLIYSPEHGKVAFTVPNMHGFIKRQPTE